MKINAINTTYDINNTNRNKSSKNRDVSFKGVIPESVADGFSKFYENTAKTDIFKKAIEKFSHSDNTFTHLLVMESCFLSGFYMVNTLRNPKIEKKQKPQMVINDMLTLGVSTAGAYLAEDKISAGVNKLSEKYFTKNADFYKKLGKEALEKAENSPQDKLLLKVTETLSDKSKNIVDGAKEVGEMFGQHMKNIIGEEGSLKAFQITPDRINEVKETVKNAVIDNKENVQKATEEVKNTVGDLYLNSAARAQADKIMPGINKLKVLVLFGLIYRFVGPVIITPVANKLSSKLFEKKTDKTAATK